MLIVTAQTTSPWSKQCIAFAWCGIPGPKKASGVNGTGVGDWLSKRRNEYGLQDRNQEIYIHYKWQIVMLDFRLQTTVYEE